MLIELLLIALLAGFIAVARCSMGSWSRPSAAAYARPGSVGARRGDPLAPACAQ